MDKYKMFEEVQNSIGNLFKCNDELTIADYNDIMIMLKALENVWIRMAENGGVC